jgi:hypothetical protein
VIVSARGDSRSHYTAQIESLVREACKSMQRTFSSGLLFAADS